MEITEVKVFPVNEEKLKAFVSIVFDRCFMVNDIKIIQGRDGLFISMPSRKKKSGEFKDIAHPLNNDTRRRIELEVVGEYERVLAERGEELPAPARAHNLGTDSDDDAGADDASAEDGAGRQDEAAPEPAPPAPKPPATKPPPPAEVPRAAAGSMSGSVSGNGSEDGASAPAAAEKAAPGEAEDEPEEHEDKLEEVQERHLRDSFWSVS